MVSRATKADHVGMSMYEVQVVSAQQVSPNLRRITVGSDSLRSFRDDGADQRFKLLLPRAGQHRPVLPAGGSGWYQEWLAMPVDVRPVMRTYTVRHARPDAGELDIDIVVHGDTGPGSAWALRAAPGDHVGLYAAWAEYEPPAGAVQLIAGDHTALPAVAAICERMPQSIRAVVLIEVPGPDDRLRLQAPEGVRIEWLDADPAAPSLRLRERLTACSAELPFDYAWVAADADTTAVVRRHLVRERGLRPDQVMFMGYWRTDGAIDD